MLSIIIFVSKFDFLHDNLDSITGETSLGSDFWTKLRLSIKVQNYRKIIARSVASSRDESK